MFYAFEIAGKPQGKARPRFAGKRAYTPAKTVQYEAAVKRAAQGCPKFEGAVGVHITACFVQPKSWSKAKRAANPLPTCKPDADNIAKSVCDALNGLAYADDAQITTLWVGKQWSDAACVRVKIWSACDDDE